VATRRSAACSAASARISSRALALEIAVATRSVNSCRRSSAPAGNGSPPLDVAIITPQVRPWTEIGTPMEERMPSPRTVAAMTPGASS
jgi:hypothetical protein